MSSPAARRRSADAGAGGSDGRAANREPSSGRTETASCAQTVAAVQTTWGSALQITSNRWPGIAIARSAASEGDYLRLPEERTVILRAKVPI